MYTKYLVRGMRVLVQDGVKWNRENDGGPDNSRELGLRLVTVDEAVAMEEGRGSNALMGHKREEVDAKLNQTERQRKPRTGPWKQCPGRTEWLQ